MLRRLRAYCALKTLAVKTSHTLGGARLSERAAHLRAVTDTVPIHRVVRVKTRDFFAEDRLYVVVTGVCHDRTVCRGATEV